MTAANGDLPPIRPRLSHTVLPTPVWTQARRSLRLPAFWVLLGLLGYGAWRLYGLLGPLARAYPSAAVFAVSLFTLYAIPFLLVVRGLDFMEREPPLLMATALAWGGIVATATAALAGRAGHDLLAKQVSPGFAADWGAALVAPAVEEPLKLLGVIVIGLIARHHVNSVMDGIVYGALVGLGFQVVEDIAFALGQVDNSGLGDQVQPVIAVFLLRGFLGGLWSHTVFSAIAGGGVGYALIRRERETPHRYAVLVLAGLGAAGLHFLWNTPVFADGFGAGVAGVLAVLVLKGVPALLLVLALVRAAGHREADYYVRELAAYGDPELATEAELAALRSMWRRSAARRLAADRRGGAAGRAVGRLQRAQAQVAVELSRGGDQVDGYRARAHAERQVLRRLGHPEAYAPGGAAIPWWLWAVLVGGLGALVVLFVTTLGSVNGG